MFLDPEEVVRHLPIRAGSRIGDFGAGEGRYAFALSARVPDGAVYAIEALPAHVEAMARRRAGNVFPLVADLNRRVPLRDALLDAGIVANTLHALTERARFARELARVMAPGAPVLVVDWMSSFNNLGPHPDRIVAPSEAVGLFKDSGFTAGAMLPAGSHHWAFVASKL